MADVSPVAGICLPLREVDNVRLVWDLDTGGERIRRRTGIRACRRVSFV